MKTSTTQSTASETTTSPPETPEPTGIPSSTTGSDETQEERDAKMLASVAATGAARRAAFEERRAKVISSATWTKLSFWVLKTGEWMAPPEICENVSLVTFPPSLTAEQGEECVQELSDYEGLVTPVHPKALAVILHKLAACVILPDKGDFGTAMAAYLEDLEHFPEDILAEACKRWRRKHKFWPTISELIAECRHTEPWEAPGEDDYSEGRRAYRRCAVFDSIRRNPAPGSIITRHWLECRTYEADLSLARVTRPVRREVSTDDRLKLVSA